MCVLSLGGVCRPLNIYLQQHEVEQDDVRVTRHLPSSLNIFVMEISVRTLSFLHFLSVQVGTCFCSSLTVVPHACSERISSLPPLCRWFGVWTR